MRRGVLIAVLLLSACAVKPLPPEMGNPKHGIDITWHGHSAFTLKDSVERTVVIDPFDDTVGYPRLALYADALLVTHLHFDHNHRRAVKARAREIDLVFSTGSATVASGLVVTGLESAHDAERGEIHGPNIIYLFQMGGLRCLHLGDIGQAELTEFQRKIIGTVDVLFIPVGGVTTIDARRAKAYVDELKPAAVFPMHYGDIRFHKLADVTEFTSLFPPADVRRPDSGPLRLRPSDLTDRPIVYILSSQNRN